MQLCYAAHMGQTIPGNTKNLREIKRTIASVLIFSSDGCLLMGKKDPSKGGVYPDAWHIPGGGVDEGESLIDAAIRETAQEVGLSLRPDQLKPLPFADEGQAEKTLKDGERVWCVMEFNRFEVRLDQTATELNKIVRPGDDLVELAWLNPDKLQTVAQVPGGKAFMTKMGYITAA